MKLRARPIALFLLAFLIVVPGLWVWWYHVRAKRAVGDYKRQLIAAGEKLTVEELIPTPVPPGRNSADVFLKAVGLLSVRQSLLDTNAPAAMRMVSRGKAMIGWAQPDIPDFYEGKLTNSWTEAEAAIEQIAEGLELLRTIVERPNLDFAPDYHDGFTAPLPNLAQRKQAAQRLLAAALCDSHRGDGDAASLNLRGMLALVRGLTEERLVISQMVRNAIAAISVGVSWELLRSPAVSDEQLAAMHRDWAELQFYPAMENALAMERAKGETTLAQMRDSSAVFSNYVSGFSWGRAGAASSTDGWLDEAEEIAKASWSKTKLKSKETVWRIAWSYPDQLRTLKGYQVVLEAFRAVRTNRGFIVAASEQTRRLEELGVLDGDLAGDFGTDPVDWDFRVLMSQSLSLMARMLNRVTTIETARQITITAIALRRHQLRHGVHPPALSALVPEFIPAVPRDPVDGQPLRYRLNNDGTFLLYSVGEDGVDNGGDPIPANTNATSLAWQRGRDWVWPQPASANEVADYFESLRKKNPRYAMRYGLSDTNRTAPLTNNAATNAGK